MTVQNVDTANLLPVCRLDMRFAVAGIASKNIAVTIDASG